MSCLGNWKLLEKCILPVDVRVYPLGLGFFRRKILTMMIRTRMKTATATPKTMYKIMSVPPPVFELLETELECWSWSSAELSDVSSVVAALPYITSCPVPKGKNKNHQKEQKMRMIFPTQCIFKPHKPLNNLDLSRFTWHYQFSRGQEPSLWTCQTDFHQWFCMSHFSYHWHTGHNCTVLLL